MTTEFFRSHLERMPLVAILRGLPVDTTVALARSCWDAGITLVEVPANTAAGLAALEATAAHAKDSGQVVGAGTIYTPEAVRRAQDAGAAFLVAPGMNPQAAAEATSRELPYLAGVGSATDIQAAEAAGLTTVKMFPAAPLGVDWLAAMRGPFPQIAVVATGGIGPHNARSFLDAGAAGVAVGGGLSDPDAVRALVEQVRPSTSLP